MGQEAKGTDTQGASLNIDAGPEREATDVALGNKELCPPPQRRGGQRGWLR